MRDVAGQPTAASSATAAQIIADLLVAIPRDFPARVWRINVTAGYAQNPGESRPRFVRSAPPRHPDISGFVAVRGVGVRLDIEVKAGNDQLTDKQAAFRRVAIEAGCIHIVARDVSATLAELREAVAAIQQRVAS